MCVCASVLLCVCICVYVSAYVYLCDVRLCLILLFGMIHHQAEIVRGGSWAASNVYKGQVHGVLTAAINFSVAFLTAKSLHLHDGHAFDADLSEGFFHILQFEGLDDCFDFFHGLRQLDMWFQGLQR